MLAYSRAIRAAGAVALAATPMLVVPVSASSSPGARHRHRHLAHLAGVCADGATPAFAASRQLMRAAVLCLVNHQRVAHGLPALRASGQLNRSAQRWADAMVSSDKFGHGPNFGARISRAGYDWAAVGENIATGFSTPHAVVEGWMSDTVHCRNILDPTYRNIGIGIDTRQVPGAPSGSATWTQDFGLRQSASPAASNWGPANRCPYS
jgi:uncharacterized protein YkwD